MPMLEPFTMRMPANSVNKMTEIAENKHLPMRTMLRSWILERIDQEISITPAHASQQANTCAGELAHPRGTCNENQ